MSVSSSKPRLPPRPELDWREDGVPRATAFDDVYYSTSSGLEETREVFFRGCGLPARWAGRKDFTIGELGFGTGLNMAAVAQLWARTRPSSDARLHLVSVEGRLMARADVARALQPWMDELGGPLAALLAQWPHRARGVQRIELDAGVRLTLLQDEVEDALRDAAFLADAWFLDGFSPARNDAMWSPQVMAAIARLSAPGAMAGTYTVAGFVRAGLAEAGFRVEKRPGFGRKRERLEAVRSAIETPPTPDPYLVDVAPERPERVVVIGAGVMGAALARAFSKRGAELRVLDGAAGIKEGTSANPLGLVMPRLDAEDGPLPRAVQDAYLRALSVYSRYEEAAFPIDIRQPAKDDKSLKRFEKILADPPFDDALLGALEDEAGLLHRAAFVAAPVQLRAAMLEGVEMRWGARVAALRPGAPAALALEDGEVLEADLIVVAAGMGCGALLGEAAPPIAGRAGQLEWMTAPVDHPRAVAGGRYAIFMQDVLLFGASFTAHEAETPPEADAALRAENIAGLAALDPELAKHVDEAALSSRTGVRATTPDRAPFVGRVPAPGYSGHFGEDLGAGRPLRPASRPVHLPGIMAAGGLGARGFTWAPLLADAAVSLAYGDPPPTGRASLEALSPARFLMRDLRRRRA